ncbi:hypothetical protein BDZ89DRAFT_280140 [Hymenopellis radicata]|nr:hypothetical protein BDZ89DRAFT_280140 [Hymenopellis radicata]
MESPRLWPLCTAQPDRRTIFWLSTLLAACTCPTYLSAPSLIKFQIFINSLPYVGLQGHPHLSRWTSMVRVLAL